MKAKLIEIVGKMPLLGPALRRMAHNFPEGSVVEIRSGAAAGYRWKRHHRYVNGYWLGHYELHIQKTLEVSIKPGQTVFDIGANAGFFTLVAARLVGSAGKVIAFDPLPDNIASIEEQLELNSLTNCTVAPQAVAGEAGRAKFFFSAPGSPMAHLNSSSPAETFIEVELTTLDEAAARHGDPQFIKMDIEGAEVQALHGATRLLRDVRPTWLIELHTPQCETEARSILRERRYRLEDLEGRPLESGAALPHHVIARPS